MAYDMDEPVIPEAPPSAGLLRFVQVLDAGFDWTGKKLQATRILTEHGLHIPHSHEY